MKRFFLLSIAVATFSRVHPFRVEDAANYLADNLNDMVSINEVLIVNRLGRSRLDFDTFIAIFGPKCKIPMYIFTEQSSIEMNMYASKNILTVVFMSNLQSQLPIIENLRTTLNYMKESTVVMVYVTPVVNMSMVYQIFRALWVRGFTVYSIYFQNANGISSIYASNFVASFGEDSSANITGLKWKDLEFKQKLDFLGRPIETSIVDDVPLVFWMKDAMGRPVLAGRNAKVFSDFLKYINATFKEHPKPRNAGDVIDIVHMVVSGEIGISMHTYPAFQDKSITITYPLNIANWCLAVPVQYHNSVQNTFYVFKPFHRYVWLAMAAGLVYIAAMETIRSRLVDRHVDFGESFVFAVAVFTFTPFLRPVHQPSWGKMYVYTLYLLLGFIVTNLFFALLGSFVTVEIDAQQIDTVADAVEIKLPIMANSFDVTHIRRSPDIPSEFKKLLVRQSPHIVDEHRNNFNTSFGYMVTEDNWLAMKMRQVNLRKPPFRYSKICFGSFLVGFPVSTEAPYLHDADMFTHYASAAGLTKFYQGEAIRDAIKSGRLKTLNDHDYNYIPITFSNLVVVVYQLLICLAIASAVFGLEIYADRYRKRKLQKAQKL